MDMRIPPLKIKIMLESNPLKSTILVWRSAVGAASFCTQDLAYSLPRLCYYLFLRREVEFPRIRGPPEKGQTTKDLIRETLGREAGQRSRLLYHITSHYITLYIYIYISSCYIYLSLYICIHNSLSLYLYLSLSKSLSLYHIYIYI